MTELKCPVCKTGTVKDYRDGTYSCSNQFCPSYDETDSSTYDTLITTQKKLDICMKALNKIANTDIKVIEREPRYYARAMFSVTNNALCRIQDIGQINEITKGGKDD